jgi:hypothetical protein
MKKSRSVTVVTVATIALALGCSADRRQVVCVDAANRVAPRASCEQNRGGGYFWYYHGAYARSGYPTIGSHVRGGGTLVPASGAVARGGFGATSSGRSAGA